MTTFLFVFSDSFFRLATLKPVDGANLGSEMMRSLKMLSFQPTRLLFINVCGEDLVLAF